jgi:hypothetical protein
MFQNLVLEVAQQAIDRPHGTGCKGAEGVVQGMDMFAEYGDIFPAPYAGLDLFQQMDDKREPFSAGGAPAARLPGIKADEVQGHGHHAGILIEDDDAAGAEA